MSSVGLEELAFSEVFDPDRVENGRKLLQIERNRQGREGISNAGVEASTYELKSKNPIDYSDGEDDEDSPLTPLQKWGHSLTTTYFVDVDPEQTDEIEDSLIYDTQD